MLTLKKSRIKSPNYSQCRGIKRQSGSRCQRKCLWAVYVGAVVNIIIIIIIINKLFFNSSIIIIFGVELWLYFLKSMVEFVLIKSTKRFFWKYTAAHYCHLQVHCFCGCRWTHDIIYISDHQLVASGLSPARRTIQCGPRLDSKINIK